MEKIGKDRQLKRILYGEEEGAMWGGGPRDRSRKAGIRKWHIWQEGVSGSKQWMNTRSKVHEGL